jgi:hypothetical protein
MSANLESIELQDVPAPVAASALGLDKQYVGKMLDAMGVDLTTSLAPSMILGTFDVMIAAELASKLPDTADFAASLMCFHTFLINQPMPVRQTQSRVLDVVRKLCTPMAEDRYQTIRRRLSLPQFIAA